MGRLTLRPTFELKEDVTSIMQKGGKGKKKGQRGNLVNVTNFELQGVETHETTNAKNLGGNRTQKGEYT